MKRFIKSTAKVICLLSLSTVWATSCSTNSPEFAEELNILADTNQNNGLDTATFGGGCFWCTEAIFEMVDGVEEVKSGYSGGESINPTYKEVCSGFGGHAEVVQVVYDPTTISYVELLQIFWETHDPTTINQQGADKGMQYRSVIYYHNDNQKKEAEDLKNKLGDEHIWTDPIVTEISSYSSFFDAEKYHQDYYTDNKAQGYCQFVITPKVEKFKKVFADKLKQN